jgi:hypothetical protein
MIQNSDAKWTYQAAVKPAAQAAEEPAEAAAAGEEQAEVVVA